MGTSPGLFGLSNSNRDFSKRQSWGKNIFNSAFPAALTCYMSDRNIQPVYYLLNKKAELEKTSIAVKDFFGIVPESDDIFFSFETDYAPYRPLVTGTLPRADLVISTRSSAKSLTPVEIKLTALPDNSTFNLDENLYGTELVVRPDTIVYMALSIAIEFIGRRKELAQYLEPLSIIDNWADASHVRLHIQQIADTLDTLMKNNLEIQRPLVMQPIWKTQGKQLSLHENAFDVFVWSDFAFTRLFFRDVDKYRGSNRQTITRGTRAVIWLVKMLQDFSKDGVMNARQTIDSLTFGTKNDKAFSVNGRLTQPMMSCDELIKPRIKREEICNIILGGGQNFLSPERRLDAAIAGTPDLFGAS